MFSGDPRLNPRLPSPTVFDGVKPSYVEWSEEILTFLSVTDYQEFVPVLNAVIGHKDVITKKVFIEGVLSEIVEEIKNKNTELEEITSGAQIVVDPDAESERLKNEIKALEDKKESRGSLFSKQTISSGMFCFIQHQVIPMSWFVASCEQQVQIQRSLQVWRSGVKWQSPMQVQLRLG